MNEIETLDIETLDLEETPVTEEQPVVETVQEETEVVEQAQPVPASEIKSSVDSKISVIKNFGENLSDKTFITDPAIGRENEIREMILALITPDKSALLVGKPGIGKTAIVEGLGYRINNGMAPDVLKGWNIIKINIPSLLGTTSSEGNTETRIDILLRELKDMENTILFIDEVHLLVNKQTSNNGIDFANMLKPFLDRGTIKMIGATTTEEYEAYVLRDRAFLRRFIKIDIAEADEPTVVKILMGTYPKFEKKMGIKMAYTDFQKENIFKFLVSATSEYKRVYEMQSRYPDVTLTLVANSFSYALFENATEVRIKHVWQALKNARNIYPDAKVKEMEKFKETFAEMLAEENVDLDA